MQHCRATRRHEPGLRRATGFLILMLWLQASLRVTQASVIHQQPNDIQAGDQQSVQPSKNVRRAWEIAHLLTAIGNNGKVAPLQKDGIYIWRLYHTRGNFKLEDNSTTLVVPKNGLYLVNLKMYYYIPNDPMCNQTLFLKTKIEQYSSAYPVWIEVMKGGDTMQCVQDWHQSVTLSQVVRFEKGTMLRVVINEKNHHFIVGDASTYLSVTRL
ncbi:hypothetical protein KOW79_022009 [Hemibagrus wyckioides]|uniref:THD domain-containing protein n=1 Tax=Hemibagrus wyckioides TaxID=337641 RepID=A0A9D3S815_9TELE|nr:uncharacterized protein LOC131348628 [Hemibagrus wyckioides]KAG7314706.1 hypothetical protein KOW79_022009 [Hemibagrus wyckioides]